MATLITGGAGFIGLELTKTLLTRGEDVILFDKAFNHAVFRGDDRVRKIKGDIVNWPEVLNVVRGHKIDTIFHLAAILSAVSEENPWSSVSINALGTFYVLEAARLFDVRKVIFTSSMGVYGVGRTVEVTEDTVQRPTTIYGVTKVFGELLGLYYHKKFGIDFRGVRFPQLIGPGVKTMGFGQYSAWLIEAAIKGEPFEVWVPEDTAIPLMYIKDAVRSLVMLSDAPGHKIKTRVYNLGQITPPPTAKDIVDEVKKYYPEAQISFKPDPRALTVLNTIPRIIRADAAEREWGWRIEYSLEETVKDFVQEYRKMQGES
jgi:threonine 3-dehydrogenase